MNEEKEVTTAEEALEGAQHIIAEQLADDPDMRKWIRSETYQREVLSHQEKTLKTTRKTSMKCITTIKSRLKKLCLIVYLRSTEARKKGF
ncbi:Tex-like N-terminal domain-containing protein [Bacillus sp. B6(2022)]|nr:Tex-like N-terminal domain-containing protein [Bacillus sp. B6(2022)]